MVACRWCRWLETAVSVVYEDETFVILAPGAKCSIENGLTLLPRAHVSVLTELPPDAMAAVLAGLSRLSIAVRHTLELDDIDFQTHPTDAFGPDAHLHFHPDLNGNLRSIFGDDEAQRVVGEKDLRAIAEAMAHSRGGLALGQSV